MNRYVSILKRDERAVYALRGLYQSYGYLPYKMSRFEEYDLYVRNKDFLLSEQIITFADRNGKLLALKPDVTLSIIKNAADEPGKVQKLYYNENVYRADKSSHSIKEIMQTGLECVGDLGVYEIAEVVLLAAKSLALLEGEFLLDISHMGFITAVLDACGVENRTAALNCLRQKNAHELLMLAGDLSDQAAKKLELLASLSGPADQVLSQASAVVTTDAERCALAELQSLCAIVERSGYGNALRVDFSVGNDMKYYSGVVFKGYLEGIHTSILSGGQYDKLLRKMGRTSKAIGFALYLDLLERQGRSEISFDVDTVILHDGAADPEELIDAAEEAAKRGSVLVTTTLPQDRTWRNLIQFGREEQ